MLDIGYGDGIGRNRQFHDEPGADWLVLLYTDGAMVVFYDAAHDRQSHSGAALLG